MTKKKIAMAFGTLRSFSIIALAVFAGFLFGVDVLSAADQYWTNTTPTLMNQNTTYTSVCIGTMCNASVLLSVNGTGRFSQLYANNFLVCTSDGKNCPAMSGAPGTNGTDGINGTSVRFLSITNWGNGSYQWNFSDGTNYTTGNLSGANGAPGESGTSGATGARVRINGTQLNGSNGQTARSYTYTKSISPNNVLVVGKTVFLQDTDYVLFTSVSTSDSFKFLIPIFDDDVVLLWTDTAALTKTTYTGSQFTGTNGQTSRTIKHSTTISNSAQVSIDKVILDPNTDYSLSTVTNTNDTLAITTQLFNDDKVTIWT